MNTEYQRIAMHAEICKRFCNQVGFDWKTENVGIDDFKEKYVKTIGERLKAYPEYSDVRDVDHISDTIFTSVYWNRYKKIYQFNPAFVHYLSETEAGEIHSDLLKRLPFDSFYISFGGEVLTDEDRLNLPEWAEPAIGMFVHIYIHDETLHLKTSGKNVRVTYVDYALGLVGRNGTTFNLFCGARNGTVMQDAMSIDNWDEEMRESFGITTPEKVNEIRERQKLQKPFFMIALNACQYLCASNAEIRDLKVSKKDKPVISVNGKKTPVSVQVSNVGYYIGKRFEKMYAESVGDGTRAGASGTKKRPHVRRAHWHHYWTGPGRTVLQVKWLEPIFVMGEENNIKTAIHAVEGDSA